MNKGILLAGLILLSTACFAQTKGTVRFDTSVKHQHITGFGGFVCSPQFGYGHMKDSEIKKVWGPSSTLGCNIMRLYLPVGENSWGQSLATAKLAKKQGAILFASPWGQPKEWKTNNFGDVYLTSGNALYAGTLSGKFVADDSNVLEFSSDPACTSMDLTAVTDLPATLPWIGGNNRVVYIATDSELSGDNVVKDGTCASLVVNEAWGAFRPALPFTVTNAAYTCTVSGQHIVQLPFQAAIPENVIVYTLTEDLQPVAVSGMVPANQPVLIEAKGEVTFRGSGEINTVPCLLSDDVLPIATPTGILSIEKEPSIMNHQMYNLHGQCVDARFRGLMISNGHKHLRK